MDRLTLIDEMLKKAFQLAYFIHGDRGTAVQIVSGAMAKLDVAATAQGKRLYYKPTGRALLHRSRLDQFRSKVTFSELHLLQRLIYIESEPYEKQKEQGSNGAAVRKEDLLVYFIKHLVRITLKRNSFYVTLGMSRLLHNYTTTEAMGIYNVVVQDPERVKDDYYYRSRKGVLMQEIKARFGDLVRICHGQRGEERFQAEPEPGQFAELVEDCLSFFTPWATPCLVPAGYDPITQSIPSLVFQGEDKEDQTEVNRIHAALHPNCYQRLIRALGFHSPDQRLEVPQFFLSKVNGDRNEGYRGRTSNLELGVDDLNTIKTDLHELGSRRRRATAGLLRVVVDGVEHARLDVKESPRVSFTLHDPREMIEVWTADAAGPLLLASYLFTQTEHEPRTEKASIDLEGGQNLSIGISPLGDGSGHVVEVGYHRPGTIKAKAARLWEFVTAPDLGQRFAGTPSFQHRRSKILIPVSALILLTIFVVGALTYLRRGIDEVNLRAVSDSSSQKQVSGESRPPETNASVSSASEAPGATQSPMIVGQGSRPSQPSPSQEPGLIASRKLSNSGPGGLQTRADVGAPQNASPDEEITRALRAPERNVALINVKTVFLDVVGNEALAEMLGQMLVKQLQSSNRFTLAQDRAEADARLRVRTSQTRDRETGPSAKSTFEVQLINAQGQVIWPLNVSTVHRTYSGSTADQISAQILKDLTNDIERLRRRR